jgi:hypothetical protein
VAVVLTFHAVIDIGGSPRKNVRGCRLTWTETPKVPVGIDVAAVTLASDVPLRST